jgi:hypothetical protein
MKLTSTTISHDPLSAQISYTLSLLINCARNFSAIFQIDLIETPGDRARDVGWVSRQKIAKNFHLSFLFRAYWLDLSQAVARTMTLSIVVIVTMLIVMMVVVPFWIAINDCLALAEFRCKFLRISNSINSNRVCVGKLF